MEPQPQLINEPDGRAVLNASGRYGGTEVPFFQASCTAGSALAAVGRGTLGWTPKRVSSVWMPS
jgi:hypothetical protein